MPPVIAFVGKPDCGKTTLLEKLTIKHHVHEFAMDREGKDTWRHKQAGARVVALSSPTGLGLIRDNEGDPPVAELVGRYFYDVDLVLAEGYKHTALPKIEIHRTAAHSTPLADRDRSWLALVTDSPANGALPRFGLDDTSGLADFIVSRFLPRSGPVRATLLVDGQPVTLNDFVEQFLARTVTGMTSTLKGCAGGREITLTIHSDPDAAP